MNFQGFIMFKEKSKPLLLKEMTNTKLETIKYMWEAIRKWCEILPGACGAIRLVH